MVDTGIASMSDSDQSRRVLSKGRPLRYIINTTIAKEYTGGNEKVCADFGEIVRSASRTTRPARRARLTRTAPRRVISRLNRMSAPTGATARVMKVPGRTTRSRHRGSGSTSNDEPVIHHPRGRERRTAKRRPVPESEWSAGNLFDLTGYQIDLKTGGNQAESSVEQIIEFGPRTCRGGH